MKYILCLIAAISTACDGSQKETEREAAVASIEVSLAGVLGGQENVDRLRANMVKERDRKDNPQPLWDTATHDAIYELWDESVSSEFYRASTDHDDLLDLKFSEQKKLDEDRRSLSGLINANHEEFAAALEAWPDMKATISRMLDAESAVIVNANAEIRARLIAANLREMEDGKSHVLGEVNRAAQSKELELSVDLARAKIQLIAGSSIGERDSNLAKLKEFSDAELAKVSARRDDFTKAIEDTFAGIEGTYPNVPSDALRGVADLRAQLASKLTERLEQADQRLAEGKQEIDLRRAEIEFLDGLLSRRL